MKSPLGWPIGRHVRPRRSARCGVPAAIHFAGSASGLPFSTTQLATSFAGVAPVFLASCGLRASIR